ncbi:hypothetical protein llap_7992 [Limosa lapponica baueri]|uniref:Uncharacterized protein n=1 Tax=Limosa lapponica baueri TaxID=1758121 RepID=A0A2I0U6I2_LIMLA|nr:hypothetical protein llap_7992 [Limosa lapponica baueri]
MGASVFWQSTETSTAVVGIAIYHDGKHIYTISHSPWANGVKSIVKKSSCDDHMTVKEGLKVSQQTRVQTKQVQENVHPVPQMTIKSELSQFRKTGFCFTKYQAMAFGSSFQVLSLPDAMRCERPGEASQGEMKAFVLFQRSKEKLKFHQLLVGFPIQSRIKAISAENDNQTKSKATHASCDFTQKDGVKEQREKEEPWRHAPEA